MAESLSLGSRLQRKLPRLVKASRHWLHAIRHGGRPRTRLVLVVGSQRSGTRLPLQVMDCSPDIATFSEGASPYFNGVLLEPLDRIERLVQRSPSPVVALKPICETHRIHELLDRFPRAKGIWIFRHFEAAVNSASLKWTSGREAVRRLAHGELKAAGWRAGGLTAEKLELVRRLYREDMSLHEANALMWYLRNGLFFDLQAVSRADILLVRYEDLVSNPREQFTRVFAFIETPTPTRFADAVVSGRSKRSFPEISPEIRALCEELHGRLLEAYTARSGAAAMAAASGRRG